MTDIVESIDEWDRCYPGNLNIEVLVADAKFEIVRLRQLLSEAEKREEEATRRALEEAALWHDAKVQEYTDQIAVNDAYLARGGRLSHEESRANEYCDDMRSCHRRAASSIRALQSEER